MRFSAASVGHWLLWSAEVYLALLLAQSRAPETWAVCSLDCFSKKHHHHCSSGGRLLEVCKSLLSSTVGICSIHEGVGYIASSSWWLCKLCCKLTHLCVTLFVLPIFPAICWFVLEKRKQGYLSGLNVT